MPALQELLKRARLSGGDAGPRKAFGIHRPAHRSSEQWADHGPVTTVKVTVFVEDETTPAALVASRVYVMVIPL